MNLHPTPKSLRFSPSGRLAQARTFPTKSVSAPAANTDLADRMMSATVRCFAASLERNAPAGVFRDYECWSASACNPQRDAWLQAIGATQLVHMTAKLLDGMVAPEKWPELDEYVGLMNAYQICEVLSDNLAIGIAHRVASDATFEQRKALLRSFNAITIDRLCGGEHPAAEALSDSRETARNISVFDQSLNGDKLRAHAEIFLCRHPEIAAADVEYVAWDALVANVETCVEMASRVDHCLTGSLTRIGLLDRYRAVDRLLAQPPCDLEELLQLGSRTISIVPTVCFYVGVIAEILQPEEALGKVVETGLLADVLYDAALLGRLFNDTGSSLPRLQGKPREELLAALEHRLRESDPSLELASGLLQAMESLSGLSRLCKDLRFGEFNVLLHDVLQASTRSEALRRFAYNLEEVSRVYETVGSRLTGGLRRMDEILGNSNVSRLISRFTDFHERLYANSFDDASGEYAI